MTMKVSRRVLLGTAAGGILALGVGGYVLGPGSAAKGFKALSDDELATLRKFSHAIFPQQVLGVSSEDARVDAQADAYIANMFDQERHLTRLMLRLMEQRSRLDAGSSFSRLSDENAANLLIRWEDDRGVWGLGVGAIRVMLAMFYFADERVQKAVGWGLGCAAPGVPT